LSSTLAAKITGSCGTTAIRRLHLARIDAVDAHRADLRIIEAQQQREDGRLAGARRADERDALARRDAQREVAQRGDARARRVVEAERVELDRARRPCGRHHRRRRGDDLRRGREQLHQALGRTRGALQFAPHFRDRAGAGGDDHRIEDERRELAGAQAPGEDIVAADPEDDADGAEGDEDHRADQERLLPDARQRHVVGRLGVAREGGAVGVLVRIRLRGADLVDRLVDVGGDVGDAVLAGARQTPHAAAEDEDGNEGRGHAEQDEGGELPAGDEQHHRRAHHHQRVAHEHRDAEADHLLQERGVVGQARDHVAGALGLEERRVETEDVVEHRLAQVGDDALAGAHHQVEAEPGGDREHPGDADHRRQRLVEQLRRAAAEAGIDDVLEALTERQHAARGDEQRQRREGDAPLVRQEKLGEPGEQLQAGGTPDFSTSTRQS
jgi:hypothetical protein